MTEPNNPAPGDGGQPYPHGAPSPGAPVPPPPPGQQPEAPQQPCGASPYGQVPQPYAQAPQQPAQPYAQAPQQPYGAPPQPPYPGYPAPPASPTAYEQPKKKAWPWVLGGCLLVFVLGIGGCVGCVSCAVMLDNADSYRSLDSYYNPSEEYDGSGGFHDRYGYPDPYDGYDAPAPDSPESPDAFGTFSRREIEDSLDRPLPNKVEDGRCSPGIYEVGSGKDIEPGRYFFEGLQDAESNFVVFDGEGADAYKLDDAVVYFGNYFADLEQGDLVVFLGSDDSLRMYPASLADFKAEAPYQSGLYRVGTDIPAGTYAISVNEQAEKAAKEDIAAFVMKDLEFDDSVIDTKYVIRGGSQTVTVKDGDWLELYGTVATPA